MWLTEAELRRLSGTGDEYSVRNELHDLKGCQIKFLKLGADCFRFPRRLAADLRSIVGW